ncbi:hypothetical protein KAR34_00390 [bacterium]|nr:hypothetical protein [bacterium]
MTGIRHDASIKTNAVKETLLGLKRFLSVDEAIKKRRISVAGRWAGNTTDGPEALADTSGIVFFTRTRR